jgi:hypothetical protein
MSYTKPVLLQNDDLAEGVYAASGDGQPSVVVVFTGNSESQYWKQSYFDIKLSGDLGVEVEVTVEFDKPFTGMSIEGGSAQGNVITIPNPKNVHWLRVDGDWDIKCTKATVKKTKQVWG